MREISCIVALIFVAVVQNQYLEPQYCGSPRPVLVPIDHPNYKYWPYFVELHRCGGSCGMISPRVQRCGPSGVDSISRLFYNPFFNMQKEIHLTNHTSCNCSCALDPGSCSHLQKWDPDNCRCICKYTADQPYTCPASFIWNQDSCECICNVPPKVCPINKDWSPEQCSCACSISVRKTCATRNELLDKNTCTCYKLPPEVGTRNDKGVPRNVLIGCMVAELLLLLIVFGIFLHCKYQTGCVTAIWHKCGAKNNQSDRNVDGGGTPSLEDRI